jgi:NAD(P)-dependent dehydrogenase (short-subunit alcohol dehydrogenase family)
MMVTGSTDGIGKETALGLARAGAHVIVHGRSRPKVDAALADLQVRYAEGSFEGASFDLGSQDAIRKGVAKLRETHARLDVLVNNAGIFAQERVITEDGIEVSLAVNHVGAFLLTELLMPLLLAAKPARVINVSSIAHSRGAIHFDDLTLAKTFTGYVAYAQSKLANVMHARGLARRHPPTDLIAFSLHPGVIGTKLLREGFGPVRGATTAAGARTSVLLAVADVPPGQSGDYFSDGVVTPPCAAALDDAAVERLWTETTRLAGL